MQVREADTWDVLVLHQPLVCMMHDLEVWECLRASSPGAYYSACCVMQMRT